MIKPGKHPFSLFIYYVQELEASIHIPADIFRNVRCLYPLCSQSDFFHLQFIVYKNAKLFPVLHSQNIELETEQEVITSVISANIGTVYYLSCDWLLKSIINEYVKIIIIREMDISFNKAVVF